MSSLGPATKAMPFVSILFQSKLWTEEQLIELLTQRLQMSWDFTFVHKHPSMHEYYEKEMGEGLSRFFVVSYDLISREKLIDLKKVCDALEREYFQSSSMKRSFNLDPGIICLEQVVLATGKPYSHRPYLGDGVYAELNYAWEAGHWKSYPWTYPDYCDAHALEQFELMRVVLKNQLAT